MAAIGYVLTFFEFPLLPSAPFLKYDASDVPALLAAYSMGTWAGIATEALKCVLFHLFGKNTTGIVGTTAMFVAGGSLVAAAGLVYGAMRTFRGALLSLVAGTLAMTAVMFFANIYVFLPLWNVPAVARTGLAISAVLPFNMLKGITSSIITLVLYKRVSRLIKSA